MPDAAGSTRKPLVLSIDDDPNIHRLVDLHLSKAGYDVAHARSGAEGLSMARELHPDLVLLDVEMPVMMGYEVCEKLQHNKETSLIPVVFATALGEEQDKAKAFAVGAVDYLVKPIQREALLEKVSRHLKTQSRWKTLSQPQGEKAEPIEKFDRMLSRDYFRQFREFLARQLGVDVATLQVLTPDMLYEHCGKLSIQPRWLAIQLAEYTRLPFVERVNPRDIELAKLPTAFCRAHSIVAVHGARGENAYLLSNPFNSILRDALSRLSEGQRLRLMITDPDSIEWLFRSQEEVARKPLETLSMAAMPLEREHSAEEGGPREAAVKDVSASVEDAPVIELANGIISSAIAKGASDIHIEAREEAVGLRFRVDGMLREQAPIPKQVQPALVSRLKIMANMDIAERRVPQDGGIRVMFEGRPVDLRVSTLPSQHGEKVVLRILDKSTLTLDFAALEFAEGPLKMFREAIAKPHGIILVTGPTGSGKTTTLYTALQALNDPSLNILSVEDPIEYSLHRVTQVQVHPEAGLTFPKALRSILRQDPDVILIGEIRDAETVDIAIKAALTGHLVLSTLHTNDAPNTVTRLLDMTEPYLAASAVELIAAQRLIRKLCPHCKVPTDVAPTTLERFGARPDTSATFYRAGACEKCDGAGYKGRTAVVEAMTIDEEMRRLISRRADVDTIRQHALKNCGLVPLRMDAFAKAARGVTSLEEVLQIVG